MRRCSDVPGIDSQRFADTGSIPSVPEMDGSSALSGHARRLDFKFDEIRSKIGTMPE